MPASILPRHRRRVSPALCFAAILVALGAGTASHAQERTVTLDDLRLETQIGDLVLSPDGSRAAVLRAVRNYDENQYEEALVLLDIRTGEERELTPHRDGVGQPAWSPDGKLLSFRAPAAEGEGRQVLVLPVDGGEARQVTHAEEGVTAYQWAADGASIFYGSRDPEPEAPEGEERHNRSFEVGYNSYLTRSAPRSTHLWRVSLDGGATERLTEGEESMTGMRVSPDGRTLALSYTPTPHTGSGIQQRVRFVELETGSTRELGVEPPVDLASFSPDGRWLAFSRPVGPEPYFNPSGIFLAPVTGGDVVDITAGIDRNLGGVEWLPDSESMLVTGTDRTRVVMWHVPLEGDPERIELGDLDISTKEVTPDGQMVVVGAGPHRPSEVYRAEVGDWQLTQLTSYNDELAGMRLGEVETVSWDGPDGFRQDGVLIYPPDYVEGRRYPLVLNIHGGPMGASTERWNLVNQAMAARGWLVFSPNYRGSSTQGRAFQTAVIDDAGDGPGRDVMSGVEALKDRGIVDGDRIAVSGWSYGGFMTAWLTAHYDGWAAAVAGAAVTDWFDWYSMADMNVWAGFGLGGSPWLNDNAENYWRQSPMAYAHQIRTPTLILSTTGDERVTVSQSYKLYHALKDNGVEVSFIAYPVGGHFPPDPVHQRDVFRRWADWIADHFGEVTAATEGGT